MTFFLPLLTIVITLYPGFMYQSYDSADPSGLYSFDGDTVTIDSTMLDRAGYASVIAHEMLNDGYTVKARLKIEEETHAADDLRGSPSILIVGHNGEFKTLYIGFQYTEPGSINGILRVFSYRQNEQGQIVPSNQESANINYNGQWFDLSVSVIGDKYRVQIDELELYTAELKDFSDATDNGYYPLTFIGLVWIGDDSQRSSGKFSMESFAIQTGPNFENHLYLPILASD